MTCFFSSVLILFWESLKCFICSGVESIATVAANSPIVPASDDRRLKVERWCMITGREKRRRHKRVPVPLYTPQIPRGLKVFVSSSEPCLKASTAHCFWSPSHASAVTFSGRYSEVLVSVLCGLSLSSLIFETRCICNRYLLKWLLCHCRVPGMWA